MASGDGSERGALAAWLWSGAGGLACAAMAQLEPSLLEEGLVLHVGERMLAGEHLYRDIALTIGPVPYAVVGGLFALFGPEIAAARAGVALLHGLACGAAYVLGRQAGAGPWAHVAAASLAAAPVFFFPLLSTAFHTSLATSLALVSAWVALRAVGSTPWAVAAGVAVAATALSKQSLGVLLAVSIVPTVMLGAAADERIRRGLALCAGGVGAAIVTLSVFAAFGDLEVFVRSLLALPRGQVFGTPFINLWPPGVLAPELAPRAAFLVPEVFYLLGDGRTLNAWLTVFVTQLLYALPVAGLALTLIAGLVRRLPVALWLFACASLASAMNLFPRTDAGHLAFAAPTALAYAVCLAAVWCRSAPAAGSLSRGTSGLAVLALASAAVWTGAQLYDRAGDASWGPRVTVRPVNPMKRSGAVPRVIHYLRDRLAPGEPIFVARTEPLIYFATGAPNPTPFTGHLQVWGTRREQQEEILGALEKVRFVVMSDTDGIDTVYADELPGVQRELERHFAVPTAFTGLASEEDWIMVLERGLDRGPTLIDLVEEAPRARAFTWRGDGQRAPAPPAKTRLPTRQNRRPLALRLGARGGGADWELLVPEAARLQFSVGFESVLAWSQPDRLRLAVSVRDGERFAVLTERSVVFDSEHGRGRRWSDVDVDLTAYAGRRVVLRLEARLDTAPEPGQVVLLGSPRIAGPPSNRGRVD